MLSLAVAYDGPWSYPPPSVEYLAYDAEAHTRAIDTSPEEGDGAEEYKEAKEVVAAASDPRAQRHLACEADAGEHVVAEVAAGQAEPRSWGLACMGMTVAVCRPSCVWLHGGAVSRRV